MSTQDIKEASRKSMVRGCLEYQRPWPRNARPGSHINAFVGGMHLTGGIFEPLIGPALDELVSAP
jgi:hypothetical protein